MSTIKLTYFTNSPIITPLMHLRTLGPCQLEDIDVLWVSEYQDLQESWFTDRNLIVVQRNFPGNLPLYRCIVEKAASMNLPIIYDIDDFLFGLPKDHPDKSVIPFMDSLLPMFEALVNADAVTVSTKKLKDRLRKYNDNIFILPNLLDETLWPFHLPIKKKGEETITIGYMGGDSHRPDIEWITPVLIKINQAFANKVNFHFYGIQPPLEFLSLPNVQWTPIRKYNYAEFVDDFHHLNFDIFIAPLLDNPFNHCKSAIKFLEYSTLGVPGIYSDLEPYAAVVKDGENGFLAQTLDEWYEKLTLLINDRELRFQIAARAQKTVRDHWLMSQGSSLWTETYRKIIKQGSISRTPKAIPTELLGEISLQLYQANTRKHELRSQDVTALKLKKDEVDALQSQIQHFQQTQQTLDQELADQKHNVAILNEKLAGQNETIESLKAQLVKYQSSDEKLRADLEDLSEKRAMLEGQINHYKGKIGALNAEITKYAQQNQSLLEQLRQGKFTIESLNTQLEEAEQTVKNLQNQIAGQKQVVLTRNEQIETLQQANQSHRWQIAEQQKKLERLTEELDAQAQDYQLLNRKVIGLENSNETLINQTGEQEQEIQALHCHVEEQLNQLELLKNQVADQEQEILFYSLSKSWRFTRPFRNFVKFLKGKKND